MSLAVQLSGEAVKRWPEIIKQASTSPLGIFALMILILGALASMWFTREKPRMKLVAFLAMFAGVVAYGVAISHAASRASNDTIYRVRVIILDAHKTPVENARVWSSLGGEPMKVQGGWQFVIPAATKPSDGKVTFYGAVDSAFLTGQCEWTLADDFSPAVTIPLANARSAMVRGIVEDYGQLAISGVRVSVIGFPTEAQMTEASGNFSLPAHAAEGQQVQLHAEKPGYLGTSPWCAAGDAQCIVLLEKQAVAKRRRTAKQ